MANWTRQDLERQTLQLLGQPANTPYFQLPAGDGTAAPISMSDQLGLWFDEAVEHLAKSCYPVRGAGSWTNWLVNKRQYLLSDSVGQLDSAASPDTSVLWAIETFTWSGSMVEGPFDRERLLAILGLSANISTDTIAGVPVAWGTTGSNLWVYKIPTIAAPAIGYGYMVPPRLTSLATQLDWISDRAAYLLCYYGAGKAALTKMDDDILAARGTLWLTEFDKGCTALWGLLDTSVRARYFPMPPTLIGPTVNASE